MHDEERLSALLGRSQAIAIEMAGGDTAARAAAADAEEYVYVDAMVE